MKGISAIAPNIMSPNKATMGAPNMKFSVKTNRGAGRALNKIRSGNI